MKLRDFSGDKGDIILHEEQMNLWEMANLRSNTTGVENVVIWVSSGDSVQHGPRIKVTNGPKWNSQNNATIPLTGQPRVIGDIGLSQNTFAEIVKWMLLNRELLLQYWNNQIDTQDLIIQLKKIK